MVEKLCVVMPVYNERDAIAGVLEKWAMALDSIGIDYTIRPYNDGSKDDSLSVMKSAASKLPRVEVRDKPNGGHGNTILTGYRDAVADGFDWVFQIDSDDEMGPEKFGELWSRRNDYDFLVGIRDGRVQQLPRKVISFVSRLCVRLFYGKSVWDVNTPYRLMRVSVFKKFFNDIPLSTFAPNVILSGLAARHHLRCYEIRVPQHDRTTGKVSIKKWKLLKAAAKSFSQTVIFALKSATLKNRVACVMVVALAAVALVSAIQGFRNGWREFDFQWDPAKLIMMHDNPYVYMIEHKPIEHVGFVEKYIDAPYLPSCLLLLAPYTLLPQLEANYAWDISNLFFTVAFLLVMWLMVRGQIQLRAYWILSCLLLIGTPWRNLIGNGQHLMFSLAFFVAALYASEKRHWLVSGVLLACSMFKYTTTVPLAFIFIWRKDWRPIVICGIIHVLLTIFSGWWLGESPIELVLQSLKAGGMLVGQGNCDMASLIRVIDGPANCAVWSYPGYVIYGILLAVVAFRFRGDLLLLLATLSIISNVMFYHRSYDFVTLFFVMILLVRDNNLSLWYNRMLRMIGWFGIMWYFFVAKVLDVVSINYPSVVIGFTIQHVILLLLLVKLFHETKSNFGKLID